MNRLKVGLSFFNSYKSWAGGVIYTLNIISSLNLLEDDLKPELLIYYNNASPIEDLKKINYPYIKLLKFEKFPAPIIPKVLSFVLIKFFNGTYFFKEKPDLVYPHVKFLNYGKRPIFWIPDFQDCYYPELFTKENVKSRYEKRLKIAKNGDAVVVLSSQDALKDFKKFYPKYVCNTALVRFASILPEYSHLSIDSLKNKFGINKKYFMVSNQFWAHKNHKIILEAIKLLRDKNVDFQVAFTGTRDDKKPEIFELFVEYAKQNDLNKFLVFLGFINRDEQLKLMDEAIAIIQPSLFEGWSTVVEDTKALSQFIIISDIEVHKEQINENCSFFDPHDPIQLSLAMENILLHQPERVKIDYTKSIQRFGKEFLAAIDLVRK
jgi:glycosyltransferase involved in cell wall biosynthesis